MPSPGAIVNIAGLNPVDDPEYRYKMPSVFGKIEGRGNGIKTVIPNISDVAYSLHRPPGEVNKFFGCELGAQTSYAAATDRAVVNGAHTDAVLQQMMHRYIENFVLCPQCGLPETEYKIKNDAIFHRCAACGAKEMVDMSHKLAKKDKRDKKAADKKAENKKKKKDKKKDKGDSDEGDEKEKEKKKKKDKKDKKDKEKKKKEKSSNGHDNGGNEKDLDGVDDLSIEEAVDDAGAIELAVKATRKFLSDNPDASVSEISDVVVNQQMASALKSHHKMLIFLRAAITPDFFKKKEIVRYAPVVSKLTSSNPIMERHLIAAVEAICADKPKNFPVMIKQLYDEDALEEDVILEWAVEGRNEFTLDVVEEETRAVLRGEAEPVVVWLQEADSDDSDDE